VLSPAEPEVERVKAWGEMLKVMRSQLVSISTKTSFKRSLSMITLLKKPSFARFILQHIGRTEPEKLMKNLKRDCLDYCITAENSILRRF
jgi:hypothetical protein